MRWCLRSFRDDTKKTRTFSQYKRDLPLNIVEESIAVFKQSIDWDFVDDEESPSDQVIDQRIRNRIIEYLELASSFEDQRIYQSKAPVHVPNEIINQWEDWVPDPRRPHFSEPVFSREEQHAIIAYHHVWTEVCKATPKRLPSLEILFETAEWQRLRDAAVSASAVFAVRGRLPEDEEFAFGV